MAVAAVDERFWEPLVAQQHLEEVLQLAKKKQSDTQVFWFVSCQVSQNRYEWCWARAPIGTTMVKTKNEVFESSLDWYRESA